MSWLSGQTLILPRAVKSRSMNNRGKGGARYVKTVLKTKILMPPNTHLAPRAGKARSKKNGNKMGKGRRMTHN